MKPLLIAHRGDTINFPENTIEAFQSAFDKGADGIELDVQVTDNNQAIIVHKYSYDKSKNYPLLQTVLEKFAHKGLLEIEIKAFEVLAVKTIAQLIKKYNPPNYTLTSSILPLLSYVRKELPKASIGAIVKSYFFEDWMTPKMIERFVFGIMNLTTANVAHLYPQQYTKSLASFLKKQGFIIHSHLYTDDLEKYKRLQELRIDRCTFDNINLLAKTKK